MDLICAPFKGIKPQAKQLVKSNNRIAYSKVDSKSVFLDRSNLKIIIRRFTKRHPELASAPMGMISVLGTDDQRLRQLHTDWLIQYFESGEKVELAISQWQSHWNEEMDLKRVNNNLPHPIAQQTILERKPGAYIWPKPLIFGETNKTLFWIIYSIQPQQGQPKGETPLDIFAAGASSKIVTFKDSERDILLKYGIREMLTMENFINVSVADLFSHPQEQWTSKVTTPAMSSLFRKLYGTAMNAKQFEVGGKKITATLENLVDVLESIVEKTNNCDLTSFRQDATNHSKHSSTPQIIFTPHLENRNDIDLGWIASRIENSMTLQNVDHFLVGPGIKAQEIMEDLQIQISSLNKTFENMYDNYVCFEGDLDHGQMQRFMAKFSKDCQENWRKGGLGGDPENLTFNLIDKAYHRLCILYEQDNASIINLETKLLQETSELLTTKYEATMKSWLINQNTNGNSRNYNELVGYNQKMRTYFAGIFGQCHDYNGKLNNVLRRYTEQLLFSLGNIFKRLNEEYVPQSRTHHQQQIFPPYSEHHRQLEKPNLRQAIMSEKNRELFDKCDSMEHQIGKGSLPLGTLTKKIILEAIRRGRAAAQENMVREEKEEIDELFRVHSFQPL